MRLANVLQGLCLVSLVIVVFGSHASAHDVEPGDFRCAIGKTSGDAVAAIRSNNAQILFKVTLQGFVMSGGTTNFQGVLRAPEPAMAQSVSAATRGFLNPRTVVMLGALDNNAFATAAFGIDSEGYRAAILAMRDNSFSFACRGDTSSAPTQGRPQGAETSQPVAQPLGGTSGGDPSVPIPSAPRQRGKEAVALGALSPKPPTPGHYQCQTIRFFSDGSKGQTEQIRGLKADGFDLFADGSYRLTGKETGRTAEGLWRAGPAAGAFGVKDGFLPIYLKRPIHVRASNNAEIIYQTDYDTDDALDEMILCLLSGPAQTQSPKQVVATLALKALNPPPPGRTRIAGLYYNLRWLPQIGANFTMTQIPSYRFRYFQDNGHVWIGEEPVDGDFARLGCSKPMADVKGEASCTTYTIENGKMRIGLEAPVPFKLDGESITLENDIYTLIPPMQDLRLDRSFSSFSYNGAVSVSRSIRLTRDGQFQSDGSVGVLLTTPQYGDNQTTVSGSSQNKPTIGQYRLNGYTLEVTQPDGKVARSFVFRIGDKMLYVNGSNYLDR